MYPDIGPESCLVETYQIGIQEIYLIIDKSTSEAFRRAPIVYFNNIPISNRDDLREIWTIHAVFPDLSYSNSFDRKSIFCGGFELC